VPYAPVQFKWPHTAVLDLIVQQAMGPHDPNLEALESAAGFMGYPCIRPPQSSTAMRMDAAAWAIDPCRKVQSSEGKWLHACPHCMDVRACALVIACSRRQRIPVHVFHPHPMPV
jgi:hypothetical protein